MPMRSEPGDVHAIINPVSGPRLPAGAVAQLRRNLAQTGIGLQCRFTTAPGEATRLAREVPGTARAALVVGGDGTVREVAAGLCGRPVPICILPAGTENIIAKAFRMPRDPRTLATWIARGQTQRVDMGQINRQRFLVICGMGFDAEVVRLLHQVRQGHIDHQHYFWPIIRTFGSHTFPHLHIEVDDHLLYEGPGLVFVGLIPRYAVGLQILANARCDDGLLDVCVYPCASRRGLLWHAFRTMCGRHTGGGSGALYAQGRAARVRSDHPVPLQVDGDLAGCLPAEFRIIPQAVNLLTNGPKGATI
jgi:diacylglycerol kinase family enzyme